MVLIPRPIVRGVLARIGIDPPPAVIHHAELYPSYIVVKIEGDEGKILSWTSKTPCRITRTGKPLEAVCDIDKKQYYKAYRIVRKYLSRVLYLSRSMFIELFGKDVYETASPRQSYMIQYYETTIIVDKPGQVVETAKKIMEKTGAWVRKIVIEYSNNNRIIVKTPETQP